MDVDEQEDEVVMRIPVMIGPMRERAGSICLVQYPLRPRWRPYELDRLSGAQVRPKQHQLVFDLEIPVAADADSKPSSQMCKLSSTATAHKTPYAIGLLRVENPATDGSSSGDEDGVSSRDFKAILHLAPLDACVQMRPDLSHIDEETGDGAEVLPTPTPVGGTSASGAAGGKGAGPSVSTAAGTSCAGGAAQSTSVLPVFKRAETEKEEEARRSSHAYWLEQRESEPWRQLQLHQEDEADTKEVRRDTFGL